MTRGPRVIVAGAGALGLTTALALADAGCAVTICDPADEPNASAVAAGMLAPVFETVLDGGEAADLDLLLAARNLWPALAGRAGIEIDRSGAVAVGSEAWLAQARAGLARLGLRGAELPRPLLEGLAPGLAADVEGVLSREDWRLDPRAALDALRQAAEAAGVAVRAEAVDGRGDADWLVIATGAGQGLAGVAPELRALAPIKGQILRYADRRGGRVSLRGEGAYAVPGGEGLAIGATMEPGRTDAEPDLAALAPLIAAAERLFPELSGATFGVSAGVRAATPDGLPMVGPAAAPGVVLAVGARRNGWLLAPLVAQIVTACVTGRDAGPYAARLDPGRFAGRRPRGKAA
ncbi:MAG TPA: FAD-dependent oxidoreductase [Phenylobacterium sp.]|jgi:glycine oxidase|uniref:NAD(P)/FAD-dependent oxidoreductase n=1 Tax=Phenylobacterium sp. TaxID=1871053 RepID=UPI002D1D427D|nr:FAD-dependent oxidoreductase [Phenylobacterium sp.]HXA38629.1 FAD-dependent oxidoreductase [Phenylobacterium sp.]